MIADAFLCLQRTSRLFKPDFSLVGQGYQGKDCILRVNAREEMRSKSGNGFSSSLWNALKILSKILFLPVFVHTTTLFCAGYPASVGRVTLCHVASRRQLRRLFGSSRTTEGFSWGNAFCAKQITSCDFPLARLRRAGPTTITPLRVVGDVGKSSSLGKLPRGRRSLRRVEQHEATRITEVCYLSCSLHDIGIPHLIAGMIPHSTWHQSRVETAAACHYPQRADHDCSTRREEFT